jgi:hypothetical protein
MPVVAPDREPDYELPLDVKREAKPVTRIPCAVWLPTCPDEKPLIRFSSRDDGLLRFARGPYELDGTIYGFDKKPATLISGRGVWFQDVSSRVTSGDEPPVVTGFGLPEKLVVSRSLHSSPTPEQSATHLYLQITENQLLAPFQIIETSYTGTRKVRTVSMQRIDVRGLGRLRFTRHYHERKSKLHPRERTVRDFLVAETKIDVPALTLLAKDSEVRKSLEDCLLIASFAARQRTVAPTWHAVDNTHFVNCYAGNVGIPEQKASPSIRDVLIDSGEFSAFFRKALKHFDSLPEPARVLLRDALYKALPSPSKTLEARYLSLFSALESTILWFRRNEDLVYTIPRNGGWRAFSSDVKSLIGSHSSIPDESRRDMILDKVSELRRIPLSHVFFAYCKRFRVDLSDLWPVFGQAGCLNDIRNRLSHGDTYGRAALEALAYAQANLEVLVERLLLAAFKWPVARSNVSDVYLKAYGWTANVEIERHMRMLKNQSRDFDPPPDG